MDGESTLSHGAWLRAALELESWADPELVGEDVAAQMRQRVAELRDKASMALADLAERGVPLRRRDDDYSPEAINRTTD
jgi:hypothetical protein